MDRRDFCAFRESGNEDPAAPLAVGELALTEAVHLVELGGGEMQVAATASTVHDPGGTDAIEALARRRSYSASRTGGTFSASPPRRPTISAISASITDSAPASESCVGALLVGELEAPFIERTEASVELLDGLHHLEDRRPPGVAAG